MTQNESSKPSKMEALAHLIETVHRLRAPGGCPWDRAQTHQSLRQYLIEEAYEVLDIIDQIYSPSDLHNQKIRTSFREELGDLLMQVLLHSEMASENQAFDIYDVAQALDEKLIRRHPHVFGGDQAESADVALQRWEKEKAKEKAKKWDASILDGVPKGLPTLQKAARVLEKVTKVGFQWEDMEGPFEKVEEEWQELKNEIRNHEKDSSLSKDKIESELGDVLFSLCNIAYLLKVNPEDCLRKTVSRFEKRFRHVEKRLKEQGKLPEQSDLPEMDRYWNEAKKLEKIKVIGLTGGIAAGKSTAAAFFSEFGFPVIDADAIAKKLTEKEGLAYSLILDRFGTHDRDKLRQIVFNDPQAKEDLEAILHPLIRQESERKVRELSEQHSLIIYEAALLFETGRYKDLNGTILIEAPQEIRKKRLLQRPGMTLDMADKILQSQSPDEEKRKHADFILTNTGSPEELRRQIQELISTQNWA